MYPGRARERGSRAASPAISSGVLSLNPTSNLLSAVSCKSLEAGIALQSPCSVSAGQGWRFHVEVEKEGQGRRWGKKGKGKRR